MAFNELNTVEHYIIHELSGVNLNAEYIHEISESNNYKWIYQPSSSIQRESTQVLVETELRDALIRLNPDINYDPKKADENTIRKMYGMSIDKNSVHGSDSIENAKKEIEFFFKN